jgi:hypothetical protein
VAGSPVELDSGWSNHPWPQRLQHPDRSSRSLSAISRCPPAPGNTSTGRGTSHQPMRCASVHVRRLRLRLAPGPKAQSRHVSGPGDGPPAMAWVPRRRTRPPLAAALRLVRCRAASASMTRLRGPAGQARRRSGRSGLGAQVHGRGADRVPVPDGFLHGHGRRSRWWNG